MPIRELSNFKNLPKEIARVGLLRRDRRLNETFRFLELPVFSTKVTERFKVSPDPIGKDGGGKLHEFSPAGREHQLYGTGL
jgi:hypothetical protein